MDDAIASESHEQESTEPAGFRARVRGWLAENAERRAALSVSAHDGESLRAAKRFQAKLFDANLAGLTWPVVYGGQGLTAEHERVFNEEAAGYVIPTGPFIIGLGICAPTLLEYGTEEQRLRHLPRMLRGDEVWCQLFSEPVAPSDAATLRTRAVRDGDDWVINGHKVWTAGAHYSDYGLLFAHADGDAPRRRGVTKFIVDMRSPGVTVNSTGGSTAVEVFLKDVRIPAGNLVGTVNEAGGLPPRH